MTTSNTPTAPALPDGILSAIWNGNANELPAAIRAERARIDDTSADLDRRMAELQAERAALALRSNLLDALTAGRSAASARGGETQASRPALDVAGRKPPPVEQKSARVPAAPTDHLAPRGASPSSKMRPDQRQQRKARVLALARKYALDNGSEFSARDLMPLIAKEGIDLGVRESHATTAVANIIYHSGDRRFSLVRRGVFRLTQSSRSTPTAKGKT